MRKLFTAFTSIILYSLTGLSQPSATMKDSSASPTKFFFAKSNYNDSIAFTQAITKLAGQLSVAYQDSDRKTYFGNVVNYYLLAGENQKAIAAVDSFQKLSDPSDGIDWKSYALAQISEKNQPGSFEKTFKTEFSKAYNPLSFRKKVNIALLDSFAVKGFADDYKKGKTKFKDANKDSLDLDDARSLTDKFFYYSFYGKVYPLMSSLIDRQYKQTFPAVKSESWAGAVPVHDVTDPVDLTLRYKLLFELTGFAYKGQDSTAKKEINDGLGSVARELNLHRASGIPKKNIDAVVVVHGAAVEAFLSNERYKKRFGLDNPNLTIIKELQDFGVKIIVCGQLMTFAKLEATDLVPGILLAFSAQTVLSTYQLKNFVHYDLSLTE